MNTTLISMTIAIIAGVGLVATLVALNFLSGAIEFLFGKPQFDLLKTEKGENGLAFSFKWNSSKEPSEFNLIKLKLFNPFGSPASVEVYREFEAHAETFAVDLDLTDVFAPILNAQLGAKALLMVEIGSNKNGVFYQFNLKAQDFLKNRNSATVTAKDYNQKLKEAVEKKRVYYTSVEKSFIAPALGTNTKALKLATNPEFAQEFAVGSAGSEAASAGGAAAKAPQEEFAVSKVWIEPGCIVCNACETIYPEVFKVNADTCIVVPNYPKDHGLKVLEAAEACPVEVIKFLKA